MALVLLLGARLAFAAESPVGKWKTVDEKRGKVQSVVEIYEQGGKICELPKVPDDFKG